jgi:indolepyruvate ferredoxin oxidoreductase, beta subunit
MENREEPMDMTAKVTNIFLSGVGGQGTILASNILGHVFLNSGYEVKKAEVHGMAQRGGDVTTHLRFGTKVNSPLIKEGDADFLLSFELLEAMRYINWVKPEGKIVINNQVILPPAVNLGQAHYPENVTNVFKSYFKDYVWVVNGPEIAKGLGNIQAANVVLVGAFSRFFPSIAKAAWMDGLTQFLPGKVLELNMRAFQKGREQIA